MAIASHAPTPLSGLPRSPVDGSNRRVLSYLTVASAVSAIAFVIVQPPVGDLWAARARESAAAHGVGLGYWFSWFSGGSTPGNYSVLAPYVSHLLGAAVLGASMTFVVTPLTAVLARGSRYQFAAAAVAALVCGLSLWSGRIPFAVGTAGCVATLIAVRHERRWWAVTSAIAGCLISPVSAVFLGMGVTALFVTEPKRRTTCAWTATACLATLVTLALVFGSPGPEPLSAGRTLLLVACLAAMLFAKPAPYVRLVIYMSMIACPLLAILPNGMGSNVSRLVSIYLPVAVVATAAARLRVVLVACAIAILSVVETTVSDLWVSAQPMSSAHYYSSLIAQLDRTPGLSNFRVEVVPDGTHTAAFALLDHAMLARGYETQEDNARAALLMSPKLDAVSYKVWLDNNAVGYVALGRRTLSANPEDLLVRQHRPTYLTRIWSDAKMILYSVRYPYPIISTPARIVRATQATMEVSAPKVGSYTIRVHWSSFLRMSSAAAGVATVSDDGFGYTRLTVTAPGIYTLHG